MKNNLFLYAVLPFCLGMIWCNSCMAQIQEGKIVFERKTNLFKKYESKTTQDYIGEKNKYRTDLFILYFNDSTSVFVPDENQVRNNLDWTTSRNTVIQDLKQNTSRSILSLWGTPFSIKDSLVTREWKFTDKWRTICNIECMQAMYEVDDSTRIYAWFTSSITPNVGPESYCNLPGAILGLATEDGAVTYFARSIDEQTIDFEAIMPRFNDKRARKRNEVIEKARQDFKYEKDFEKQLKQLFMW